MTFVMISRSDCKESKGMRKEENLIHTDPVAQMKHYRILDSCLQPHRRELKTGWFAPKWEKDR